VTLQLSHFSAALIFAVFSSVVFGITQRSSAREQLRYGLRCFVYFILGTLTAAWLMWLLKH
jgi:Na+/H+-dicarboxylate symporter